MCSPDHVARLAEMKAQIGYRYQPGNCCGKSSLVVDNTLDRQYDVDAPDRNWAKDITYVRTQVGFTYLAIVIDLYARRVAGWSMQSRQTTEVVLHVLLMAVWRLGSGFPVPPAWTARHFSGLTIWNTP